MSASISTQQELTLDDKAVAEYLSSRPDFFANHPDALMALELPHQSGGAVSLVERQVSVLRERNMEMRNRLAKLVDAAQDNDHLFEQTRRLVLGLLAANTLKEVVGELNRSLTDDFKVGFNALYLLGDYSRDGKDNGDQRPAGVFYTSPAQAREAIGGLIDSKQVVCGVLRPKETAFLFGEQAEAVKSAAIVPIGHPAATIGILSVGSQDPNHYKNGMGTLFLSYIGEILAQALPKYL